MANQVSPVRRILAVIGLLFSPWLLCEGIMAVPRGGVMGGPIVWLGLLGGASVLSGVCILILIGRR